MMTRSMTSGKVEVVCVGCGAENFACVYMYLVLKMVRSLGRLSWDAKSVYHQLA